MEISEQRQRFTRYVTYYTEWLTELTGVQHFLPPVQEMSDRELLEWSVSLKRHLEKAYRSAIARYYRLAQLRGEALVPVKLRELDLTELKKLYNELSKNEKTP